MARQGFRDISRNPFYYGAHRLTSRFQINTPPRHVWQGMKTLTLSPPTSHLSLDSVTIVHLNLRS